MRWDDLQTLAAVRAGETYASAATALGVDETTVGRRVARLEAALKVRLFDLVDGRRRPTRAAQSLLRHVDAMARTSDEISRWRRELDTSAPPSRIRLATTNALAEEVLAPHLPRLLRDNAGMVVELLTSTRSVNFSRWEADLAIRLRKPAKGNYRIVKLASVPLVFFEPRRGAAIVCCYPASHDDMPESRFLTEQGLQQDGRCVTASGRTIRTMILSGGASGILPGYLCRDMMDDPRFLTRTLPDAREVWLLIQDHLVRDRAARAMVEWLKSCFAPAPETRRAR